MTVAPPRGRTPHRESRTVHDTLLAMNGGKCRLSGFCAHCLRAEHEAADRRRLRAERVRTFFFATAAMALMAVGSTWRT